MTTTRDNITDEQINALRQEAAQAADDKQIVMCEAALAGDDDARRACAEVIAYGSAEASWGTPKYRHVDVSGVDSHEGSGSGLVVGASSLSPAVRHIASYRVARDGEIWWYDPSGDGSWTRHHEIPAALAARIRDAADRGLGHIHV